MKTIIAGSRSITDRDLVFGLIKNSPIKITEVVEGEAAGVDVLGKEWAIENGVPFKPFPADWKRHGKKVAGFVRNQEMADYAEALILIWDGKSTGSMDMKKRAIKAGLVIDFYDLSQPRLF